MSIVLYKFDISYNIYRIVSYFKIRTTMVVGLFIAFEFNLFDMVSLVQKRWLDSSRVFYYKRKYGSIHAHICN